MRSENSKEDGEKKDEDERNSEVTSPDQNREHKNIVILSNPTDSRTTFSRKRRSPFVC